MRALWQVARWRWQHRGCLVTHQRVRGHDSLAAFYGRWCIDHQQGMGRMRQAPRQGVRVSCSADGCVPDHPCQACTLLALLGSWGHGYN